MTFDEKLFKLRKKHGLSQEALAEKLSTTRQAISKWENGQGYPETEKLLMMGNIFEVSMDYLLKDNAEAARDYEEGFYVSREMAEGFLMNQHKTAKYMALGVSLIALAFVPYFAFRPDPTMYTFPVLIFAALGILTLISAEFMADDQYKILKQEPLLIDQDYLKELTARYESIKKKNTAVMAVGISLFVIGMIAFGLEKRDITLGVLVPYYPVFLVLIAIGVYMLIRSSTLLDAYKLLVKNEEYVNRLSFKLRNKARKKVDQF